MSNWELITYELWGNSEDGYEVNAAHTTGRVIEIDDAEDDDSVAAALVDAGIVEPHDVDDMDLDGDEHVIYVNMNSWPYCEFRPTDEEATGRLQ